MVRVKTWLQPPQATLKVLKSSRDILELSPKVVAELQTTKVLGNWSLHANESVQRDYILRERDRLQ